MLVDALLLVAVMIAWGAQATAPWRLAGLGAEAAARAWRLVAFPAALAGLVAAYLLGGRNPDAAIGARLVPLGHSAAGRLLALMAAAALAAALIEGLAGARLGKGGLRLAALLGLLACGAAAWAGELLRTGEGPPSPGPRLLLLCACRLALFLAAGELFTPGRPRLAPLGGLAALAYLELLPPAVRNALWGQGLALTCAAAALLLGAARWLPRTLRAPALAAGLVLAGLVLAQAGHVSQDLAPGRQIEEVPATR